MTRWASLFTLSSLARYEPALLARPPEIGPLDLNASKLAVVLEEILEAAQERVPELLYEVLTEEQSLQRAAQSQFSGSLRDRSLTSLYSDGLCLSPTRRPR